MLSGRNQKCVNTKIFESKLKRVLNLVQMEWQKELFNCRFQKPIASYSFSNCTVGECLMENGNDQSYSVSSKKHLVCYFNSRQPLSILPLVSFALYMKEISLRIIVRVFVSLKNISRRSNIFASSSLLWKYTLQCTRQKAHTYAVQYFPARDWLTSIAHAFNFEKSRQWK